MPGPRRASGAMQAQRGAPAAPTSAENPHPSRGSVPAPTTKSAALRSRLRRAFLVLVAIYATVRVRSPEYWDPLDDLNLAVHEAGHLVFSAFGETMGILGGSLFQILVPLAFVAYFWRTRQHYAAAVTTAWIGVNLLNVARYIGDARAQELPLLGGEDSIHDWWYLLINWDLLPQDLTIARWVHFLGAVAFLSSLIGGLVAGGQSPNASRGQSC